MEEGALTIPLFLTRLIMPVSTGAAILGLLTILKGLGGFRSSRDPELSVVASESTVSRQVGSHVLERVAAALCGAVAVVLLLVLGVNSGRSGRAPSPWTVVLLLLILLLTAPALLWKTRYRVASEGAATVAIAGVAMLTGFSIGFLFVPLIVLMFWLCIFQLRS
jgi:hypothetical protein